VIAKHRKDTMSFDALAEHARELYGVNELRPFQRQAVVAALRGHDVVVRAATGAGKSLCYQLPATLEQALGGTVLVVSPLLALMREQTATLRRRGVAALYLGSDHVVSPAEEAGVVQGAFRLVYVSPEGAGAARNVELLRRIPTLLLIAVDEAHCVSSWGHDFRPAYRDLALLRARLSPPGGEVAMMALTATATDAVLNDIVVSLGLRRDTLVSIKLPLDRPNLRFAVFAKRSPALDMKALVDAHIVATASSASGAGCTLIYCSSRAMTETLARQLAQYGARAAAYHAGLGSDERQSVVDRFCKPAGDAAQLDVVVATVAFGMGIDKSDVRSVVNYGPPQSLQDYYQQAGRAGRDGRPALCLLFWGPKDFVSAEYVLGESGADDAYRLQQRNLLNAVRSYASSNAVCRRKMLLEYFGEAVASDRCGNCDACDKPAPEQIDVSSQARLLLGVISEHNERYGAVYLLKVLLGSGAADVIARKGNASAFYGRGQAFSRTWWAELLQQLRLLALASDVLRERFTLLAVSDKGRAWLAAGDAARLHVPASAALLRECGLDGKPTSVSSRPAAARAAHGVDTFSAARDGGSQSGVKRKASASAVAAATTSLNVFTPLDAHVSELFGLLLGVRTRSAQARRVPPYTLWDETALRAVATTRPDSVATLLELDAWAASKSSADELQAVIDCVRAFCLRHGNLPMTHQKPPPLPPTPPPSPPADAAAKKARTDVAVPAVLDDAASELEREFRRYLTFFRDVRGQARAAFADDADEADDE
jgi:ATP-dependent DNA helicase RecQ